MNRQEWLKYSGNMQQVAGLTELEYTAGKGRGMRVWQVKTAGGLVFDLLPDKAMGMGSLSYKGVNMSWLSKNGVVSGLYGYPVLNEFDHYFDGGMLWTCGLKNAGSDHVAENGVFQHLHGRLGITPCESAFHREDWEGDDYVLNVRGCTRDSHLAMYNLMFNRSIKIDLLGSSIEITDEIENCEPEETDYFSLYHFNFGFPFISPDTKIIMPEAKKEIIPRSPAAEAGIGEWEKLTDPIDGEEEQCFFHHPKEDADGLCSIRLENEKLGIAATLTYENALLPILTQWKSVRSGEYVLGIEPGNSYLRGEDVERAEGNAGIIEGFGKKTIKLKLEFESI